MLCDCISKTDLNILRNHLRVNRDVNKLPLFIFPCGGDQSLHSSRRFFRAYVSNNQTEALKNVFLSYRRRRGGGNGRFET